MDSSNIQSVASRFAWLKTKMGRIIIVVVLIAIALFVLYLNSPKYYGPQPLSEEEIFRTQNMIQGEKNPPVKPLTEAEHKSVVKTIQTDDGTKTGGVGSLTEEDIQATINQIQAE